MAASAARWIQPTGVGGPDCEDGIEPGTVWIAVHRRPHVTAASLEHFDGDPTAVCAASVERGLELVLDALAAT